MPIGGPNHSPPAPTSHTPEIQHGIGAAVEESRSGNVVPRSASGGEKPKFPGERGAGTTPDGFQGRKFFRRNRGDLEHWRRRKLSTDGGLEKRKGTGAQLGAPLSEESQYLVEDLEKKTGGTRTSQRLVSSQETAPASLEEAAK